MPTLDELKAMAKQLRNKPVPVKDQAELTDVLLVVPKEEVTALIDALYHTLSTTTSETFGMDTRKSMLSVLKRLES